MLGISSSVLLATIFVRKRAVLKDFCGMLDGTRHRAASMVRSRTPVAVLPAVRVYTCSVEVNELDY